MKITNIEYEYESSDYGTNPCGEIILKPYEFCNLSEVVVRSTDTYEDLQRKVRLAAILGTFQSSLTDFKYIRKAWADNCKEERLLGVSLTGIMDNSSTATPSPELAETLTKLKDVAITTNREWAEKLLIEPSAAITTVE